ncbi:MAG: Holliday junction branch migration protein RuvA [Lentisphaerae bacterium]|nr:Holliday junction branch migration protein RuvA [Lentisphaerota bacterium]
MITFLEGLLVEKTPTRVVLNVGGVGYEVFIPLSTFDHLGAPRQTCRLLTYDFVREDSHSLFGFVSEAERKLFVLLMSVSGIGPKIAMSALSGLTVREVTAAIAGGDVKRLSGITGIGRKLAERMVVELRDKLSAADGLEARAVADLKSDHRARDAVLALISLGYRQTEAQQMIAAVLTLAPRLPGAGQGFAGPGAAGLTVEEIVRKALTR